MNYEIRIAMAERELAHLKEMQKLEQTRLDAHDSSLDALEKLHLQHVKDMAELRQIVKDIGEMLKSFLASLGARNGPTT